MPSKSENRKSMTPIGLKHCNTFAILSAQPADNFFGIRSTAFTEKKAPSNYSIILIFHPVFLLHSYTTLKLTNGTISIDKGMRNSLN